MDILTDEEIYDLCIAKENPIIEGIPERDKERSNKVYWYRKESPIQPSSIDLHIGNIYIPGKKGKEPGSECCPIAGFSLDSGATAVVVTQEKISLPNNIAGIGFPPSTNMSFKGILMTNPGHIDPGYKGHLHFTLINMGKKKFALNRGEVIVSLLLFRLSCEITWDWLKRRNQQLENPSIQQYLDSLSPDFMDFKNRSVEIAKAEVNKAQVRTRIWSVVLPVIGTLLAAFITGYFAFGGSISKLEKETAELRGSIGSVELKNKIENVDSRLKDVENKLPKAVSNSK